MVESLAETVRALAARTPERAAFRVDGVATSWAQYQTRATRLARLLVALGLAPGERVGVLLPDGAGVHVAFLANELAGLVSMGIGPRAGLREIEHLLRATQAAALITLDTHQDQSSSEIAARLRASGLAVRHHLVVPADLAEDAPIRVDGALAPEPEACDLSARSLRPDQVFLLNSTSGTSGMPKVVVHDQLRWLAFHELALRSGRLCERDVFMSVVPAPFGFGLWTAHFSPALLGVETVLMPRFSAEAAWDLLERHGVTVLAAVSTQFILMLDALRDRALERCRLRVLYTGGEIVPEARAAEFEQRTGAKVLQFYGSNETGAVSATRLDDPRDKRLQTSGRAIPEMNLRLFDSEGRDVTARGRGQPGVRGPTLSRGYWNDPEQNTALLRADGWMLLGDVVEVDAEGYLRVVGRTDDFIIRGGKNISGPAVEVEVASHPAVALAAAVAMPDPVFGERVCAYVELREGASLSHEELIVYLRARGVSRENFPERLEVVAELPRGSGGKVAKQALREDIRARIAAEACARV